MSFFQKYNLVFKELRTFSLLLARGACVFILLFTCGSRHKELQMFGVNVAFRFRITSKVGEIEKKKFFLN